MKAVIFDLDGTLLNTLEDLKNSTNYALKVRGFEEKTQEHIRNSVGNGIKMLIARCLPKGTNEDTIDAVFADMKHHYKEHCHDFTVVYDGILTLLEQLMIQGYKLAIVSNKADTMVQELNRVFFDGLISVAIGETTERRRKPDPDMVNCALEQLGVSRENAVYVGDSEVDIQTGKNAGICCLSVGWGFRTAEILLSNGARNVYSSPAELYEAIMSQFRYS